MSGPDDDMEMPALGRPFRLGMLYNCYKDALLLEHSFLDSKICGAHTEQITQASIIQEQVPSDTIRKRAAALGIKPSLLTSLLCGLFEADGCAKYLLSAKTLRRPGILTCRSLAMERFEKLDLNNLGLEHCSSPKTGKCAATHVVTGVWFGDQAIWDYDKEVCLSSSEIIEEKLGRDGERNTMSLSPQAKTTPQTEVEERAQKEGLSFSWDGAPSPEQSLGPFQDPVKIPKRLGESRERGVPIKVRLYPLMDLDLKDPQIKYPSLFHEIRDTLNSEIVDEMEGLLEIEARCNDLLNSPAATAFPEIGKKIHRFRDLCEQHKQDFQKKLAEMVPLIREGKKEEKDLEEVLKRKKQSPFGTQRLGQFLDEKEQEVSFVNSVLSSLKEIKVNSFQNELLEKIYDPNTDFVIVLMFTSLNQEETFFSELRAFLFSGEQPETSQRETQSSAKWYEDQAVIRRTKEVAKSFLAFAHANRSNKKTQFLVASVQDESSPGASIYLYENGLLEKTIFEPLSKPLPPEIEESSHDRVRLSGKDAISRYQVEGRIVGQEDWDLHWVNNVKEETVAIMDLCPDTKYEFRYAAMSKPGTNESCDVCRAVRTLHGIPPRCPKEIHGRSPSCFVGTQGNKSEEGNTDSVKTTMPTKIKGGQHSSKESPRGEMKTVGDPLTSASNPFSDDGTMSISNPKGESESLASSLSRVSGIIRKGQPSLYALSLEKSAYNGSESCVKYTFEKQNNPQVNQKVVMFLGETGAGKSTLINRMANHILGVRWEDDFRYNIVQDGAKGSQAHSRTDRLTVYEINWNQRLQVPFSLTLVDTPGFGDTRGVNHDKRLMEEIRSFFNLPGGIDHIDAICLVVQASQARLTQSQKYILDKMFSIFGKDIRDNVVFLITFADGRTPPVLQAIEARDLPCARDAKGIPIHFTFNNSALFASNVPEDEDGYHLNQKVWEMGERGMGMFFQTLNDLGPQSLTQTRAVLNERKELEATLQSMKPQVQMALVKVGNIRKIRRALEKHPGGIKSKKNLEYEVENVMVVRKEISDRRHSAVNCQRCKYTCLYPWQDPSNSREWKHNIMDKDSGLCLVCPHKCPWEVHCLEGYMWDYNIETEKQSLAYFKEKYLVDAYGRLMTEKKVLDWFQHRYAQAFEDLVKLIEALSHHLQRLQQIALRPNRITAPEYIDLLISSEERELQTGFAERIEILKSVKGSLNKRAAPKLLGQRGAIRKAQLPPPVTTSWYYQV